MFRKCVNLVLTVMMITALFINPIYGASGQDAVPTASTVLVNGTQVAFDAYNISGNNYFKLRDVAYTLNGTEKQFEVGWDSENNAISLTSGLLYTAVGGEMSGKGSGNKTPAPTNSKIYLDSVEVSLTAYNIEGNNYFKLRDIGKAFDFGVDWDGARNTIVIDTSKGYTPESGEAATPDNNTVGSADVSLTIEKVKQTAESMGYGTGDSRSRLGDLPASVSGVSVYVVNGDDWEACISVLEFTDAAQAKIYSDYMSNLIVENPDVFANNRSFAYDKFHIWTDDLNRAAGKDVLKKLLPSNMWSEFGGFE